MKKNFSEIVDEVSKKFNKKVDKWCDDHTLFPELEHGTYVTGYRQALIDVYKKISDDARNGK